MSNTAAWVVPVADDVAKWLNAALVAGVNELDAQGEERLDGATGILRAVVDRVRGAVGTGNRTALSLTANSVPPEARDHCMTIAAYELVNGTPLMEQLALKDAFTRRWEDAVKWVEAVRRGDLAVTEPTDPDPDRTPAGPTWGDYKGENVAGEAGRVDLSTDGI